MDLVIMAAGLGSRFGGLKQLQSVDNKKNFIIDYSIFDAIKAGFNHIIFIIKEENFVEFKNTIGSRIEKFISVDYVFQDNNNIPSIYYIPQNRIKPFGTGHAVLCAKNAIKSDFAVINSDDFYGRDALRVAYDFLNKNSDLNKYALIGYEAINTIGENGCVKRGVCKYNNGKLLDIVESSLEKLNNNSIISTPIASNAESYIIENNQLVSMNLFAFSKNFLNFLEEFFISFLDENKYDLSTCEFFLPTAVGKLIKLNKATVEILKTTSKWFGITYKDDLENVKNELKLLVKNKIYPENLWNIK